MDLLFVCHRRVLFGVGIGPEYKQLNPSLYSKAHPGL